MALNPSDERHEVDLPDAHDHPLDDASDWGWHGEWGRAARVGGWIVAVILVLMMTATHYNGQGTLFLGLSAGGLILALLYDRQRRKNAWRQ